MTGAVFPDAEATVIDYLTPLRSPVQVVGLVPTPRPAEFIRIERLGGARETRVTDAARLAVEAWAATDTEAAALLNLTRADLADVEAGMFGADEYGGPTRLPDPRSGMSRYTASYTIRMRPIQ